LSNEDKLNTMAGTKNNPGTRQTQRKRYYQGKEMKPCLYIGKLVGKGRYMSGSIDGQIIMDEQGNPMPFHAIPVTYSVDTAE
jgi:hypothetical protein